MFDGKAFGVEIVAVVKDYVARALEPLLKRLEAVEARVPADGKDGQPGKDGCDGKDAAPITREMIVEAVRSDPSIIAEAVRLQLEARPVEHRKDGRDGEDGKDGRDGKDADPVTAEQIDGAIRRYFEANPPPAGKDGKDGSNGASGANGAPGEPGKDGVGLAGMLIDRSGGLVATLSDGSMRALGLVLGKDGEPGAPGRDGADGLGFDDMTAEYDGERGITLRFARGDQTKEFAFSLHVVLDRGVFKEGNAYSAGDAVTWGGSLWIAQKATSDKPEAGDGWRLAVKRGRDGKQGDAGKPGAPGAPGSPGKDLTQLGPDGRKW